MPGPSPQYITIRYNKPGSCSIPLREQVGAELRKATAYVTSLITAHACSRDSSGGILITLRAGRSNNRGSTLGRNKRCSCCKGPHQLQDPPSLPVHTSCRTQPSCPSICTQDCPHEQTGRVAKLTFDPILTPGLTMNGLVSPLSLPLSPLSLPLSPLSLPLSPLSQGQICLSSLYICHGAELVLVS